MTELLPSPHHRLIRQLQNRPAIPQPRHPNQHLRQLLSAHQQSHPGILQRHTAPLNSLFRRSRPRKPLPIPPPTRNNSISLSFYPRQTDSLDLTKPTPKTPHPTTPPPKTPPTSNPKSGPNSNVSDTLSKTGGGGRRNTEQCWKAPGRPEPVNPEREARLRHPGPAGRLRPPAETSWPYSSSIKMPTKRKRRQTN
jgi:hypothetical protein